MDRQLICLCFSSSTTAVVFSENSKNIVIFTACKFKKLDELFLVYAVRFRSVFLCVLQDLDAALPIIEKYKDQLVAIGEVKIEHL